MPQICVVANNKAIRLAGATGHPYLLPGQGHTVAQHDLQTTQCLGHVLVQKKTGTDTLASQSEKRRVVELSEEGPEYGFAKYSLRKKEMVYPGNHRNIPSRYSPQHCEYLASKRSIATKDV